MADKLYPRSSPYFITDIINNKYLGVMVNRYIPRSPTDEKRIIEPIYQYRPDKMAYDLYGDGQLWWVFACRNPDKLEDPYFDFVSGLTILVPNTAALRQSLGL